MLQAFECAQPGDIFVQKAPACTVGDLALALRGLLRSDSEIRIIGTRHGEKLYESLVSREEMARAEDLGGIIGCRLIRAISTMTSILPRAHRRYPNSRLHVAQYAST